MSVKYLNPSVETK